MTLIPWLLSQGPSSGQNRPSVPCVIMTGEERRSDTGAVMIGRGKWEGASPGLLSSTSCGPVASFFHVLGLLGADTLILPFWK